MGDAPVRVVVERPTSAWLVVAAVAQAVSAVAIAIMTYFLVRFNRGYVDEMARANSLQEQANAISSGLLSRAASQDAPFLVSASSGGHGSTGGLAEMGMKVQNRGGGLAHDITVETTWGPAHFDSLGEGDALDTPYLQKSNWDGLEQPQVIRFRFRDAAGTRWVQAPNQIPVEEATESG